MKDQDSTSRSPAYPTSPPELQSRLPAEPPIVGSPTKPSRDFQAWLDRTVGSESYGAPRVFDLFTLFAITLAFALLFGFMRMIEPLFRDSIAELTIAISVFVTLTAVAQQLLFSGEKPRLASIVGGPAICFLTGTLLIILHAREGIDPVSVVSLMCFTVLGPLAGYLAGGMVAGVFLIADRIRQHWPSRLSSKVESCDSWLDED